MSEQNTVAADVDAVKGWFAGRLPDGWFTGVEVTLEGDQIVVVGRLPEVQLSSGASEAEKAGAAAGRISRFREETRRHRIWIAREAESRFDKNVTWGAATGSVSERFTPGGSGRGEGKGEAKPVMIGWRGPFFGRRRRIFGFAPWMVRRHQRRWQASAPTGDGGSSRPADRQSF